MASAAAAGGDDDDDELGRLIEKELDSEAKTEATVDDAFDTLRSAHDPQATEQEDKHIIEVYRRWCMQIVNENKGALVACEMHKCHEECSFYSCEDVSNDIYICMLSGNLHMCTTRECAYVTESMGSYVCILCGKVYSESVLPLTIAKWIGGGTSSGGGSSENQTDGYSFAKAPRTVRSNEKFKKLLLTNDSRRKRGMKPLVAVAAPKKKTKDSKKTQMKSVEELAQARIGRLFGSGGPGGSGPAAVAKRASSSAVQTGRKKRTSKKERKAKRAGEKRKRDAKRSAFGPAPKKAAIAPGGEEEEKSLVPTPKPKPKAVTGNRGLSVLANDKQRKLGPEKTAAASTNYALAILHHSSAPQEENDKYAVWLSQIFYMTWQFISTSLVMLGPKTRAYTFQRHCYVIAWVVAESGMHAHECEIVPQSQWLRDNIPPIETSAAYGIIPNDVQHGERILQQCFNDMPLSEVRVFCTKNPFHLPV